MASSFCEGVRLLDYVVRKSSNTFGSKFEVYELGELETDSWVRICPERGGLVVSMSSFGTELLYLDEQTFADKDQNVRGGIPVLWPICGQLPDAKYTWNGTTYDMPNHGLARRASWSVVDTTTTDSAAITLRFASDADTKKNFPFDFELLFTYRLVNGQLTIEQRYTNLSDTPMPMYAGFHPYFLSSEKCLEYETDADSYLDYNDQTVHGFTGSVDMDGKVESLVLQGASTNQIAFTVPQTAARISGTTGSSTSPENPYQVFMEYGPEFRYIVLWTVAGKPFICVEPWMAPTGTLHSGQGLVMVEPNGGRVQTFLKIGLRR